MGNWNSKEVAYNDFDYSNKYGESGHTGYIHVSSNSDTATWIVNGDSRLCMSWPELRALREAIDSLVQAGGMP